MGKKVNNAKLFRAANTHEWYAKYAKFIAIENAPVPEIKERDRYGNPVVTRYPYNWTKGHDSFFGRTYQDLQERIKTIRKFRRMPSVDRVRRGAYRLEKVGGVYADSDTFIKLFDQKQRDVWRKDERKLERAKRPAPKSKESYIGIEIEFISKLNHDNLRLELAKAGVTYATLKFDGSINTGMEDCEHCGGDGCDDCPESSSGHAHEIAMISPESKVAERLKALTDVLNGVGRARVNKSCGLHVHLDMRHRDVNQCFDRLRASQPILYGMVPAERYDNSYCHPIAATGPVGSSGSGSRYYGINRQAYTKHKTIEVRIHSGSTNYAKILNWVTLLTGIVSHDIPAKLPDGTEALKASYGVSDEVAYYVLERSRKHKTKRGGQWSPLIALPIPDSVLATGDSDIEFVWEIDAESDGIAIESGHDYDEHGIFADNPPLAATGTDNSIPIPSGYAINTDAVTTSSFSESDIPF